jgi:hypothetical protein
LVVCSPLRGFEIDGDDEELDLRKSDERNAVFGHLFGATKTDRRLNGEGGRSAQKKLGTRKDRDD